MKFYKVDNVKKLFRQRIAVPDDAEVLVVENSSTARTISERRLVK